jgi:hypothetical protein
MKTITVSVDEETAASLYEKRHKEGKPVSLVVRRALQETDLAEI